MSYYLSYFQKKCIIANGDKKEVKILIYKKKVTKRQRRPLSVVVVPVFINLRMLKPADRLLIVC